jgi:hypothetical protein
MENKLTGSEHARDASEQIIKKPKIRPAGMEPHRPPDHNSGNGSAVFTAEPSRI